MWLWRFGKRDCRSNRVFLVNPRLLVGRGLLTKRAFTGQAGGCWPNGIAGQTGSCRSNRACRPNGITGQTGSCRPAKQDCGPNRVLLVKHILLGKQVLKHVLLVLKTKSTEFCSFGASEHDGAFPFPTAPGGAETYLFRWLASMHSNKHILGCSGDHHPLIALEWLRFGPSRTCYVAISRSVLSFGGIVANVALNYDIVSRVVYSYR